MRIRWRRLLVSPRVHVVSREGDVTTLRVDGLVCDTVCAARSQRALASLPGVRQVRVDYDAGTATVVGPRQDEAAYDRAVKSVVAGKLLRRAIEHAALTLRSVDRRRSVPVILGGEGRKR